jgi:hypothetical protein
MQNKKGRNGFESHSDLFLFLKKYFTMQKTFLFVINQYFYKNIEKIILKK